MDSNNPSGYPASYPQPAPPNSTTATISLIMGILGLTFLPLLGSIVALFTGYSARKEINQSAGLMSGSGMATAGIVMGWIGVGLGALTCCFVAVIFGLTFLGITLTLPQNYLPIFLFI